MMNLLRRLFGKKEKNIKVISQLIETEKVLMMLQELCEKQLGVVKRRMLTNRKIDQWDLQRKKVAETRLKKIDGVFRKVKHQRQILQNRVTTKNAKKSMKKTRSALQDAFIAGSVSSVFLDSLTDAIRNLKATEEILTKKQKFYEDEIEKQVGLIKKNASKNIKVTLQAFQKKKRFEQQLRKVDGALTTLEQQREVLENANKLAGDSIKKASDALASAHKNINVEQVDRLLDELSEQNELTNYIADAISQPVGFIKVEFDEDELEKELAELSGQLSNVKIDELPTVHSNDIETDKKKEKVKAMEASK